MTKRRRRKYALKICKQKYNTDNTQSRKSYLQSFKNRFLCEYIFIMSQTLSSMSVFRV